MPTLEELYAPIIASIYPRQPEAGDTDSERGNAFVQPGKLTVDEQLAVYRGSVLGGLTAALADIYPAVLGVVGKRYFDAMAVRYIDMHPSRSASLDDYGASMPDFLKHFTPLADYSYLPDLAKLEWAWHRVFHMADPALLDVARLSDIDSEHYDRLRFVLIDALYVLESSYPLQKIWAMSRAPESSGSSEPLDISEGAGAVAVYRLGLETCVETVSDLTVELISAIKKGDPFGTICEQLLSKYAQQDIHLAVGQLIERRWVADLKLEL